jgi:nucleoside-diphosphate-sugar epimerase
MRVFVTGASGWIGSATVDELLAAGHEVTGLARSGASAAALEAKGASILRGDLDDLARLQAGAKAADAVIHLANKHDFAHPEVSNAAERAAVQAIGDALVGTNRPFLLASGVAARAAGRPATEDDPSPFHGPDSPRGGSENLALEFISRGVHTVSLRFAPTVHGTGDHGFIAVLAAVARAKGVSGYPGDGTNRWAAVHISDAARMVTLGLTGAPAGARLHAVAEDGVPTRDIADAIGRAFGLPVASIAPGEVADHFGWIGTFFSMDLAATAVATRTLLGWTPAGPTLVEDLAAGAYSHVAALQGHAAVRAPPLGLEEGQDAECHQAEGDQQQQDGAERFGGDRVQRPIHALGPGRVVGHGRVQHGHPDQEHDDAAGRVAGLAQPHHGVLGAAAHPAHPQVPGELQPHGLHHQVDPGQCDEQTGDGHQELAAVPGQDRGGQVP